jgi:predicted ester cyclase
MTDPVARYFDMWNTGDISIAGQVLAPGWVDHSHPRVTGISGVQESVATVRAASPGLSFTIDAILTDGELATAIGRVGATELIWLVRIENGLMAEMWTYTTTAPATADE